MVRKLLLSFAFLCAHGGLAADLVPASSLAPSRMRVPNAEHGLGVVGGIPARTSNVIDLTASPYNFIPGENISTALTAAIADLATSGSEAVLLMPPGTHLFSGFSPPSVGGLTPKSDYTIRGAGMGQTILVGSGTFNLGLDSNFNGGEITVSSGLSADSNVVTVSNASLVTAGRFAKILFPNDSRVPVFKSDTNGYYVRSMIVYVLSVNTSANTVTFTPPLPEDFSDLETHTGLPVKLRGEPNVRPLSRVGLEGFTLDLTGSGVVNAISLKSAYNCWLKDVKYIGHAGHGFLPTTTVNLEFRSSWVGASSGSGSNKSGILVSGSSNLLIEDSIIEDNQPGVEFWLDNTNCWIGYTYFPRGTNRLNINIHNAHNSFIITEGSIAANVQVDTYFGTASKMGVFRSWLTGRHGLIGGTSITRSGETATVTTTKPHTYASGNTVAIRGAVENDYNGNHVITVTSPTTFTYTVSNSPSTPATGSISSSTGTFVSDIQALTREFFFVGNILRSPGFANTDAGYLLGWPYGSGGVSSVAGEAEPSAGDWWYDYDVANSRPKAWQGTLTGRVITSATRVGNTVTITTSGNHGHATSATVTIAGLTGSIDPNGNRVITVTGATAFTFTLTGATGDETYGGTGTATRSTAGAVAFSEAVADDIEASLAISSGRIRAASYANFTTFGTRSGNMFPISASSSPLPAGEATVTYYPSVFGFRERDLDTVNTTTKRVNYNNFDNAIPTGEAQGADTFPNSLYLSAKPDWFGSLVWPPIDPYNPPTALDAENVSVIPAAYRYFNGTADYMGPSAPSFSTHPTTQTATVGDNVTLTVAGNGSPAPTLQWRKGGVNISGATSSSLVLSNVQLSDAGSYDCVATNSEGAATSNAAVLTVNAAPSEGGNATINVLNVGTLNLQ